MVRRGAREEAPAPLFTLELPDGWAGGHGPVAYMEAVLAYGRAHPECPDRAMERLRYPDDSALYAAIAVCGSEANMLVSADDVPPSMSGEDALDAYVTANQEDLASNEELLGEPTVTNVDIPFPGGRLLRWSWSWGASPSSFAIYAFGSGGRLWQLTFSTDAASAATNEQTFQAIASSFRLMQAAPTQ